MWNGSGFPEEGKRGLETARLFSLLPLPGQASGWWLHRLTIIRLALSGKSEAAGAASYGLVRCPAASGQTPWKIEIQNRQERQVMQMTLDQIAFANRLIREMGGVPFAATEITEAEAIRLIKETFLNGVSPREIKDERQANTIKRNLFIGGILEALGLSLDLSEERTDEEIVAFIKKNFVDPKAVDKAVDEAMLQGKLHSYEKEWALGFAAKEPEVFRAFVAARKIVKPLSGESVEIDDTQKRINRQLGVTDEVFLKYCGGRSVETTPYGVPEVKLKAAIDDLQRTMNESIGVSEEMFLKYGVASR